MDDKQAFYERQKQRLKAIGEQRRIKVKDIGCMVIYLWLRPDGYNEIVRTVNANT